MACRTLDPVRFGMLQAGLGRKSEKREKRKKIFQIKKKGLG
jgi:hypothetical protein